METQNILVPIDFSVCSKHAVKVAVELAMRWEAHIHLINAIRVPVPHADIGTHAVIDPVIHEYEDDVKRSFDELEDEVPSLRAVTYHTKTYVSHVTDAISSEIDQKNIDLVVMGTKGSHDPIEKLLGSVSSEVISFAHIPVLMVPENISSLKIKKIGLALDNRAITMPKKLAIIPAIADIFDAEVVVFNIHKAGESVNFEKSHNGKLLSKLLKKTRHTYQHITSDSLIDTIYDFIGSSHLDMLVVMPRKHGLLDSLFHKSTSRNLSMKVKVPMLSIHQ